MNVPTYVIHVGYTTSIGEMLADRMEHVGASPLSVSTYNHVMKIDKGRKNRD